MANPKTGLFPPSKRGGLVLHGLLVAVLASLSAWGFWQLAGLELGPAFILRLVLGIIAFAPIPILGYRTYALYRALYRLDRDSLEIRWGLRDEIVPLSDIEWVRPVEDLTRPLVPPATALPGAVLGLRRHGDLGVVEFLASRRRGLLLVGTARRVYAISPADPTAFLETFARAVELGSLHEAKPKSQFPSLVFTAAWESGAVRYLWLATLFLNLGLAAWVSMLIPSSPLYSLGMRPDRNPEPVPSSQLILIPLLSALLSLIGWIAGLFFFRWVKRRSLSMLLWGSGVVASLLFVLAVLFIVITPL